MLTFTGMHPDDESSRNLGESEDVQLCSLFIGIGRSANTCGNDGTINTFSTQKCCPTWMD
jgi:hypothetical protein